MNKYLVIGNPIDHSLSPKIHNYWFEKYKFKNSIYESKKIEQKEKSEKNPDICPQYFTMRVHSFSSCSFSLLQSIE